LSGYAHDALVRDDAIASGAAFLAKPITPDALSRKVREVLDAAPVVAAVVEPPVRPTRRSSPPSGGGRHILHIDDEESLVVLTARILKRLGYQVTSFTDPGAALEAFRDHPASFDAVVTDVTMRRMTGFELVRAVWEIRPDMPVVVTSGDFRPEDVRTAEAMQIRDLVVKPDTVEELGRVLHEAFSRPRIG
jgi:CheY-like chemotaxis protein